MKRIIFIITILIVGLLSAICFTACSGSKDGDLTPMTPPAVPEYNDITVGKIAAVTFNGAQHTPKVTVKNGEVTLVEGTDYTLSYGSNKNIGLSEGKVTISFIGKYEGRDEMVERFDILAIALSEDKVTLNESSFTFDGAEHSPKVTVTDGQKTLVEGTDYDLYYADNINAGSASVTVNFKGLYRGYIVKKFEIAQADIDESDIAVSLKDTQKIYQTVTGKLVTPALKVLNGTESLTEGIDYKVVYTDNLYCNETLGKGVGTATVKFLQDGNYDFTGIEDKQFKFDFYSFENPHNKVLSAGLSVLEEEFYGDTQVSAVKDNESAAYKAVVKSDGLYIAVKANHKTAITIKSDSDQVTNIRHSTNIDFSLLGKSSVAKKQFFIRYQDKDIPYIAKYNNVEADFAVLRTHEITGGYATVAEVFFSKAKLLSMFGNASEFEKLFNMKLEFNSLGADVSGNVCVKPDTALVTPDGIYSCTSATAGVDFGEGIVLGKGISEWSSYGGYTAVDNGINAGDGKDSTGFSFRFKAVKKPSGIYALMEGAVPKIDVIPAGGLDPAWKERDAFSAFRIELAVRKGSVVSHAGYYYFGKETNRSLKPNTAANNPIYHNFKVVDQGASFGHGRYKVTVEAYIPWSVINISIGSEIVDITTGEFASGYELRFGGYWKVNSDELNSDDKLGIYTTAYPNGTKGNINESGVTAWGESNFDTKYYFDEHGEMASGLA